MFYKILIVAILFQLINAKNIGDNVQPWHPRKNLDKIEIEVDDGYRILVNVTKAEFHDFDALSPDPDPDSDESDEPTDPIGYVLIQDNRYPDQSLKKDQLIIAHHVKDKKAYVFNSNKIVGVFYSNNGSFDCTFEKFGDKITTTTPEPTTTENPFPTPPHNLTDANYTNYVFGKPAEDYRNQTVLFKFREAVSQMANEYCSHHTEIHLNESVTPDNVKVTYLIECPINWPEADVCVRVTFELPVVQKQPKLGDYQLTRSHLERMWELYADKYLNGSHSRNKDELSPYDTPDVDKVVTFWAVSISLVILVLIVGMFAIRKLCSITDTARLRYSRNSDQKPIVDEMEPTDMMPHIFQDIPPFFEKIPKPSPTGPIPYADDDDDNSSLNS